LAAISSRRSPRRSERILACCFSHRTVIVRPDSVAWTKKTRSPGWPTVPTTNRAGSRNSWTALLMPVFSSRLSGVCSVELCGFSGYVPAGDRIGVGAPGRTGARVAGGISPEARQIPARVVDPQDERAVGGVPDHRDRRRVHHDPL